MIRLKSLKPGFSFLEIMIAITLLSIFGTTLFMIQSTIFSKTSRAHNKVVNTLELNKLRANFELEKFNLLQEKKSIASITIHKELTEPSAQIKLNIKSIPDNSVLFKNFSKNVRLVHQEVIIDGVKDNFATFIFTPQETREAS